MTKFELLLSELTTMVNNGVNQNNNNNNQNNNQTNNQNNTNKPVQPATPAATTNNNPNNKNLDLKTLSQTLAKNTNAQEIEKILMPLLQKK